MGAWLSSFRGVAPHLNFTYQAAGTGSMGFSQTLSFSVFPMEDGYPTLSVQSGRRSICCEDEEDHPTSVRPLLVRGGSPIATYPTAIDKETTLFKFDEKYYFI